MRNNYLRFQHSAYFIILKNKSAKKVTADTKTYPKYSHRLFPEHAKSQAVGRCFL